MIPLHLGVKDNDFRRKFRSGLTAPDSSAFVQTFTPDAEGKLQSMTWRMPGMSEAQAFASYRYAGGRVLFRSLQASANTGSGPLVDLTVGYNDLRQLISLDYKNGSTSLFNLQITRDAEGNVTKLKYPKVNGKAGDSFKLDGFDRLEEAKMGVSTVSTPCRPSTAPPALPPKSLHEETSNPRRKTLPPVFLETKRSFPPRLLP